MSDPTAATMDVDGPLGTMSSKSGVDDHTTRRIIAEDHSWNLPVVPRLQDKCMDHIIANFAERPILHELPPKLQREVIAKISLEVPLEVTAKLIDDEAYWKRQCKACWALCDVSLQGGVWKSMFFEKSLENMIASFVPGTSDEKEIEAFVNLANDMVRSLTIREMHISEDAAAISDARTRPAQQTKMVHLDPAVWLPKLKRLERLSCSYNVEGCGMSFTWSQFGMKLGDAHAMARVLALPHCIRSLQLHKSLIGDTEVRVLASALLNNETLVSLNLSHNNIGDRGARAIAKLLSVHKVLKEVDLCDNQIRGHGARCIAHALETNSELVSLNLRLNRIGDEGGIALSEGLLSNSTLQVLNIASNSIGTETCSKLAELLKANSALHTISLNCNRFGVSGGNTLREGIDSNTRLQRVDLRLSDVGQETEFIINELLKRNNALAAAS